MQAPRVSYLPLLMPEIKKFLMDVVFDEAAAAVLKEEDWWFESEEGTLLKWHWPIGLIYDNHIISSSIRAMPHASTSQTTPLQLILHLASPPTDKLLLSPSAEACKQAFMGQLKEADFMRWGNTKRMTGLRKAEQDGMWEGVKEHNFDDYWRVASKITPTTTPNRPNSPPPVPPSSASMHSRPSPSIEAQQEKDGAYNVRSVPIRIYLPDGPVMQELVPPVLDSGLPHTLSHYLSTTLPLLFPPAPLPTHSHSLSHSLSRSQHPLPAPPSLAYALIQGVLAPSDAEMAWLGACMAGADGWVNVCVGIVRDAFGR